MIPGSPAVDGDGDEVALDFDYDKEISHNHILRPTNGQEVIQLVA